MKRTCTSLFVGATLISISGLASADETGLASSHDLRKENGKLCMSDHAHSGYGTGSTKAAARAAAIRSWIDFTNLEYGSSWASYSASASQTTKYVKEEKGWGANVEGRPCRK
jgi:hypothetical protein